MSFIRKQSFYAIELRNLYVFNTIMSHKFKWHVVCFQTRTVKDEFYSLGVKMIL